MSTDMTSRDHEAMRDLVAVYALDALDADEAARVESHLAVCARCRSELGAHREAAAMLAYGGTRAPEGLWGRIAATIEGTERPSPPVPLVPLYRHRRRRWVLAAGWAGAGIAATVMAVLGVSVAHEHAQLNSTLTAQASLRQVVAASLQPGARRIALSSFNGPAKAEAVILGDGRAYLVDDGLSPLATDRTYQLWAIVGGQPISAAVLGPDPDVAAFRAAPGATTLAITNEVAGGARRPTSAPVATGAID